MPSSSTSIGHDQAGSQLAEAAFYAPGLVVTIPSYAVETLILAKGAEVNWEAPSLVIFSDQVPCTHVVYPISFFHDSGVISMFDPISERVVTLNSRERVLPLDVAMAAAAPYEGRSVIFDWDACQCLETTFSAPVQKIDLRSVEGERQLQRIVGATLSRALPQFGELEVNLTHYAQGVVCENFEEILSAVNAFALTEVHRNLNSDQLLRLYSIICSEKISPHAQESTAHMLDANMVLTSQTIELVHRFARTLAKGDKVRTDYEHSYHTPFTKILIESDSSDSPRSFSFWRNGKLRDLEIAERMGMQVQHHTVRVTATAESLRSGDLVLLDLSRLIPGLAQRDLRTPARSKQGTARAHDKEPCSFYGVPALVSLIVAQRIAPTREELLPAENCVGLGSSLKALVSPSTGGVVKIQVTIEFQEAWADYSDEPRRYYEAINAALQNAQQRLGNVSIDGASTSLHKDELGSFSGETLPAEIVLWPQALIAHARKANEADLPQKPRSSATPSLATTLARPTRAGSIDLATQAHHVRQYKLRRDEVVTSAWNGDRRSLHVLFYLAENGGRFSKWSERLLGDIVKGTTSSQFSVKAAELILEKIHILPRDAKSFIFQRLLAPPQLRTWRPEPPGAWVCLLREEVMRKACLKLVERSQILSRTETEQLVSLLALTLPHRDVARGFLRVLQSSPGGELYKLRDRLLSEQLALLRRGGIIFKSIEQPQTERGTYALFLPGLDKPLALDRDKNGYEYTGTLSLQFDEHGNCTTSGFRTSRSLLKSDCVGSQLLPSLYIVSNDGSSIPFPFPITEVVAAPLMDSERPAGFMAHCRISINSDWWSGNRETPSPLLRGALIQRDLSSWGEIFPALHPESGMQLSSFVAPPLLQEMERRCSPQGERSRYGKRYDSVLKAWQETARHAPSFNPEGPVVRGVQKVYHSPLEQLSVLRSSLMSPLHLHLAQEELALVTAATTFHLRFLPHYFSEDEHVLYERLLNESIARADSLLRQGAAVGMSRMMKFDAHLQVLRLQSARCWHDKSLDQEHSAYVDFVGEVSVSMRNNCLKSVFEVERLANSFRLLTSSEQLAALKTISDPMFSALYCGTGVSPRLSQYYADREMYLLSFLRSLCEVVSPASYRNSYDEAIVGLIRIFAVSDDKVQLAFPS